MKIMEPLVRAPNRLWKLSPRRRSPNRNLVHFWIDVFGIPIHDPGNSLRAMAIARMGTIYWGADVVLALDNRVLDISRSTTSEDEICARILQSAWAGRYWTYQEGCLAKRLLMPLRDGVFVAQDTQAIASTNSSTTVQAQNDLIHNSISDEIRVNPLGSFGSTFLGAAEYIFNPETRRLFHVWHNCIGRSTTKADDVPLIMATLLGFAIKDILAIPPKDRVKAMLYTQGKIPLKILFNNVQRAKQGVSSVSLVDCWMPDPISCAPIDFCGQNDFALVVPGQGLKIDPFQQTDTYRLRIENISSFDRLHITDERFPDADLWVQLHGKSVVLPRLNQPFHLIVTRNGYYRSQGALVSLHGFDGCLLRVLFMCAVTVGPWKHVQFNPDFLDCSVTYATRLEEQHGIIIEEGEHPWSDLRFTLNNW
ncbi:MAG: hypothetical protein Q9190_000439 [Brigantiaea leucoxantha]